MIARIISEHLATYHELETIYGIEDAFNLYEIILVKTYNEIQQQEAQRRQNGN